ETATVTAGLVACACGAGIDPLLTAAGLSTASPLLEALNLVIDRAPGAAAIGGRTTTGKTFFLVPYHGRVVCGTWESSSPVSAGEQASPAQGVEPFVSHLNEAFPSLRLSRTEV